MWRAPRQSGHPVGDLEAERDGLVAQPGQPLDPPCAWALVHAQLTLGGRHPPMGQGDREKVAAQKARCSSSALAFPAAARRATAASEQGSLSTWWWAGPPSGGFRGGAFQ